VLPVFVTVTSSSMAAVFEDSMFFLRLLFLPAENIFENQ
jgi:hypothetical protein